MWSHYVILDQQEPQDIQDNVDNMSDRSTNSDFKTPTVHVFFYNFHLTKGKLFGDISLLVGSLTQALWDFNFFKIYEPGLQFCLSSLALMLTGEWSIDKQPKA